jgi:hypothetical protein
MNVRKIQGHEQLRETRNAKYGNNGAKFPSQHNRHEGKEHGMRWEASIYPRDRIVSFDVKLGHLAVFCRVKIPLLTTSYRNGSRIDAARLDRPSAPGRTSIIVKSCEWSVW